MRIASIVPVAESEPLHVIERSVRSLKAMDCQGFIHDIYYVVDVSDKSDYRISRLKDLGVHVIARKSRGKRAGAINDALEAIGRYGYVAVFDVDSRPEKNFLRACLKRMEEDVFIVSTPRKITNEEETLVTRVVSLEYSIIGFLYRKFSGGFLQFNGLIGLLRYDLLRKFRLDESRTCEDVDFTTRMYLKGYRADFATESTVGEQAPRNLRDLISQRVRWYTGALEMLEYMRDMFKSHLSPEIRIQWLFAMVIPLVILIFLPLNFLSPLFTWKKTGKLIATIKLSAGLVFHTILLQLSAFLAVYSRMKGKKINWSPPERSLS